jgi:hypothetical protein
LRLVFVAYFVSSHETLSLKVAGLLFFTCVQVSSLFYTTTQDSFL